MKTVADPAVTRSLIERLSALTPESQRRWGTLTPHEMLCHLGDAGEMVLRIRPRDRPLPRRRPWILKAIGLWTPLRWPHGWKTNPSQDPRLAGTRPSQFAADRERVVTSICALATAAPNENLEPVHGTFGAMSLHDWQRWAWKHTDHHLRQFGL